MCPGGALLPSTELSRGIVWVTAPTSGARLGSSALLADIQGFQASSAFCLQAPVMWQVLLIDDEGILVFLAENVVGSLICSQCTEKALGLVTGQQVKSLSDRLCQTHTLRLDPP